jgi:hypothetical protein
LAEKLLLLGVAKHFILPVHGIRPWVLLLFLLLVTGRLELLVTQEILEIRGVAPLEGKVVADALVELVEGLDQMDIKVIQAALVATVHQRQGLATIFRVVVLATAVMVVVLVRTVTPEPQGVLMEHLALFLLAVPVVLVEVLEGFQGVLELLIPLVETEDRVALVVCVVALAVLMVQAGILVISKVVVEVA